MDLIKCPRCGEEYSDSYPCCPFCEEEDNGNGGRLGRTPRRRIAPKNKAQSARGGLIVVLILVLALLSWYLFGDKLLFRNKPAEDGGSVVTPVADRDGEAAAPTGSGGSVGNRPDGAPSDAAPADGQSAAPQPEQSDVPPEDANVDVSNAKLNRSDFTLNRAGERFQIKVSGTTATPRWSIDNANVATLGTDGTVTAVANGTTTVRCKVGTRELTCIVRVNGTGKSAAAASAPTTAEPVTPSAPVAPAETKPAETAPAETKPAETKPAETGSSAPTSLRVKTNVGGVLPKSDGKYDCTVRMGGDKIRLIAVDENGKEVSVSWSSADTGVVTVGEDGHLSPQSAGSATVTGSANGVTVTCIIRVRG